MSTRLSGFASTTFRSLRIRNYRLFFGGQLVSMVGTWMQTIALGWLVLAITHNSGTAIGTVTAAQFVPTLVLGVWGGVVADRFDKRRILVATQTAMALTAGVLAAVTLSGAVTLWMVFTIVVVQGLAQAVDNPTRQAFVAEMVPAPELPNAIALNSAMFQMSRILGPALAGVIIALGGTGTCFLLNAVSFVAVIGALVAMRSAELYRTVPVVRARGQIRDGFRYIRRTPALRSTLLITAIVGTLAIEFQVVLPLIAKVTFHGAATTYGWITVGMGLGALVGALFIASRAKATGRMLWVCGLAFGFAICLASVAPTLPTFLVLMPLMGAGQITFLATCNSLIQLTSDPAMRGRVMAVYMITLLGSTPIGGPIVGWISQEWGARYGLAVGGVATLLTIAVFGTAFVRARGEGREEPVDELALAPDGMAATRAASAASR